MTPAAGTVLATTRIQVSRDRLDAVAAAIGTDSARQTAALVPVFGPTVQGERSFLEALGIDLGRSTMGEQQYRWTRPFIEGESIDVRVVLDETRESGRNRLYVVGSVLADAMGAVVQRQTTTFVERIRP